LIPHKTRSASLLLQDILHMHASQHVSAATHLLKLGCPGAGVAEDLEACEGGALAPAAMKVPSEAMLWEGWLEEATARWMGYLWSLKS
jgi:hypothetical protein